MDQWLSDARDALAQTSGVPTERLGLDEENYIESGIVGKTIMRAAAEIRARHPALVVEGERHRAQLRPVIGAAHRAGRGFSHGFKTPGRGRVAAESFLVAAICTRSRARR